MKKTHEIIATVIIGVGCLAVVLPLTGAEKPETKPAPKAEKPRVDIWVTVPGTLDRSNPTVRFEYKYVGAEGSVTLQLPKDDEVMYFRNVRLEVDGKPARWLVPFISERIGDIELSRMGFLGPGKSVTLDVPLAKIFKIPENWKTLEVVPTRSEVSLSGLTGTLKVISDKTGMIDPVRPDTWDDAATRLTQDREALVEALIAAAKNEKRSNDKRRKAIFLLGDIRNKRSFDFLIEHVSMKIPMTSYLGDADRLKETPGMYVFWQGDWDAAKAIMDSLWGLEKPKKDMLHLGFALKRILRTKKFALAAIDSLTGTRGHRKKNNKNLTFIKTYLTEE